MNHPDFEAALHREGYKVFYGGIKPGVQKPEHSHTFDARVLVLGGEIIITQNGIPKTIRAGDYFEIPAGTVHSEQTSTIGVAYLAGHRGPGA